MLGEVELSLLLLFASPRWKSPPCLTATVWGKASNESSGPCPWLLWVLIPLAEGGGGGENVALELNAWKLVHRTQRVNLSIARVSCLKWHLCEMMLYLLFEWGIKVWILWVLFLYCHFAVRVGPREWYLKSSASLSFPIAGTIFFGLSFSFSRLMLLWWNILKHRLVLSLLNSL